MEEQKNHNQPQSGAQQGGQRISVRPGNFVPPAGADGQKPGEGRQGRNNRRRNRGNNRPQNAQNAQNGQNTQNAQNGQAPQNPQPGQNQNAQPRQNPQSGGQNRQNDRGSRAGQNRQNDRAGQNRRNDRGSAPGGRTPGNPQGAQNGRGQNAQNPQAAQNGRGQNAQNPQGAPTPARPDARGQKNRRGGSARPQRNSGAPQLSETLQRELDEEFSTPMLSSYRGPAKARAAEEEAVEDTHEFEVDIATAAYLVEDIPTGIPAPGDKVVEVIGVRFRQAGKVYFFAPDGQKYNVGDSVIVDTARGPEVGQVVMLNRRIAEKEIIQPLRHVIRKATQDDLARDAENHRQEEAALKICAEKIAAHKLDMRLVDAQYAFDNSKLLFYFTSENRVDFRELVRDLAGVFHTRIELRQIGIRDESRLIGGLGMCGRPFCCSTFLSDFGQVSVKMAKEQGLSINASKISGCCGRLMCCLRYEYETYRAEARLTPKKDTAVQTPDGAGVVVESTPLSGLLKVRVEGLPEEDAVRVYHRDDVTPIGKAAKGERPAPEKEMQESPAEEPESGEAEVAEATDGAEA